MNWRELQNQPYRYVEKVWQKATGGAREFRGIEADTQSCDPNTLTKLSCVRIASVLDRLTELEAARVQGDYVECGVWRGGLTAIVMAWLKVFSEKERHIWACDTFAGYPAGSEPHRTGNLVVSLEQVRRNMASCLVCNDKDATFLVGDFNDTLPGGIKQIALLYFDADSPYAFNTVFDRLYDKVPPGGVVIVDDWNLPKCREAALKWRADNNVTAQLISPYTEQPVEGEPIEPGIWWRKQ